MAHASLAYVVLHHTGLAEPHFDLMIEREPGGLLRTWRCARWPALPGDVFTPLPDHRRVYLTYEGSLSLGRGTVRRVDEGLAVIAASSDPIELRLNLKHGAPATLRLGSRAGEGTLVLEG